jgi:hypothetical protein
LLLDIALAFYAQLQKKIIPKHDLERWSTEQALKIGELWKLNDYLHLETRGISFSFQVQILLGQTQTTQPIIEWTTLGSTVVLTRVSNE